MRIELKEVTRSFKGVTAVDGVSLSVESGELLVILGPSGCGKSTLLRIIAGLDEASTGQVLIGEQDVTGISPDRRGISMVFQSYALFPHLNVAENIVFGLRIRGCAKADMRKRLETAAGMLGLEALLERKPSQLSGGQRQRVALGRAIVSQQPICLMDEPLSNLDAKLRHEMRREVMELHRTLKLTMIYVTHDQVEAITMADRIVLLNQGRVAQIARPQDLYSSPSSIFAAQFIGSPPMNMLELENTEWGCALKGDGRVLLTEGNGEPLFLGVRPEDIRPADDGIPGMVRQTEYHGADTLVTAGIGDQSLVMRLCGKHDYRIGSEIRLLWNRESSHLFGAKSGLRYDGLRNALILPERVG